MIADTSPSGNAVPPAAPSGWDTMKMADDGYPRRREDRLLVRELEDEILVYDLVRYRAYCLNATAALVWRRCDGKTPVEEMTEHARDTLGLADAGPVVRLALRQLSRASLVDLPARGADLRCTRRDVLRKLGAAAALAPVVMGIVAPTARAAASDTCTGTHPSCGGKLCPGNLNCHSVRGTCQCQ